MSDADTGSMNGWHARAFDVDHIEAAGSRKNATNTRGRPFGKGNAGRPKGALNRATLAAQALLNGEALALTRLCVDRAFEGDPVALKLCMERILPPRKELPVEFTLPPLQSGSDLTAAMAAILKAAAEGRITVGQAVEFGRLLQLYGQTASASDPDDLAALTDDELRARILRIQARTGTDINFLVEHEAAAGPRAG